MGKRVEQSSLGADSPGDVVVLLKEMGAPQPTMPDPMIAKDCKRALQIAVLSVPPPAAVSSGGRSFVPSVAFPAIAYI
jgi:hypothetical protein